MLNQYLCHSIISVVMGFLMTMKTNIDMKKYNGSQCILSTVNILQKYLVNFSAENKTTIGLEQLEGE